MNLRSKKDPAYRVVLAILASGALTACAVGGMADQSAADARLETRVAAALANASDLPAHSLAVTADDRVVMLTGSVACEDCGGNLTPGGSATVQQNLGAVVRAVPGVERVEFDLQYQPGVGPGP